jgi:hypothetical protein
LSRLPNMGQDMAFVQNVCYKHGVGQGALGI